MSYGKDLSQIISLCSVRFAPTIEMAVTLQEKYCKEDCTLNFPPKINPAENFPLLNHLLLSTLQLACRAELLSVPQASQISTAGKEN